MSNWHVTQNIIDEYLQVCREAVDDDKVFNKFKSDPRFTAILEHCRLDVAINYLDQIKKDNPTLFFNNKFKENDKFGGAKINIISHQWAKHTYSTSTIQYIGVLSNLIKYLPSLNDLNIIEIGGGYGGQCKIIHDHFKPKSYTIVDLPEVCQLQQKYLSKFKINVKTINSLETTPQQYDLIISNYAITEVRNDLKQVYIDNIVLNSKYGYITCNRVGANQNLINTLQQNKNCVKISDVEKESEDNCIIYWK